MAPKKRPKSPLESEDESDDESEDLNTCKVCKKVFQTSIMKHLGQPKSSCLKHYSQEEYLSLKQKCFKRKEREKNAKYYSKNAKLLVERQAAYDAKNRKNILTKRAIYYQVNRAKILEKMRQQRKSVQNELKSVDRIRNFRQDIIEGPVFVCCSCKRELFKTGVKFLDSDDITNLKTKQKLQDEFFKEIGLDGFTHLILCQKCLNWIKKGRVPNINVQNGLYLERFKCGDS